MRSVSGSTKERASGSPQAPAKTAPGHGPDPTPTPGSEPASDPESASAPHVASRLVRATRLDQLVDRLAGEIVLRYAAGQRTLDFGVGAPAVTAWVQQRAASLRTMSGPDLLQRGPTPTVPHPDGSFEVVYSLRTLPHLGTDEASSEAAARWVLREMARVLTPGGVALVQIDNPRSLRGMYHGIRNPMTVVGQGALTLDTLTLQLDTGLIRFDTLRRFLTFVPRALDMRDIHGLGVLTPVGHVLGIPIVGPLLGRLEWWARDAGPIRHFGAYMLVVLRRLDRPLDP